MKKFLLLLLGFILATLTFFSCKKEEDEGPGYYFRFQADGVAYDYEFYKEKGLFGGFSTMGAAPTGSSVTVSNYQIYGSNHESSWAFGRITFELNKSDFATMDTIILDGIRNLVSSEKLEINDYEGSGNSLRPPLLGRLIITERGESHLKGTFEFDAYRYEVNESGVGDYNTGIVVHFTSGLFYVPARFV